MRKFVAIIGVAAIGITACSDTSTDDADEEGMQTVNFSLNYFPLADHAPYYLAYDKEYYLDAGLQVNILQGSGSGESIRRVDSGQADLGIADTGTIVNAIRGGADLQIVGMVWDESALAIHARRDSGIEDLQDLVGKSIGAPQGDSGRMFFPTIAEANNIDDAAIEYVDVSAAAKYGALSSGQVDAIFDATTGKPLVEEAVGTDNLVTLKFADYGFDMYGHAIFTSGRVLEDNPDMVAAFLDKSYLAWSETFQNPEAALEVEQKYAPQIELEEYGTALELVFDLMRTPRYEENGIGYIDADRMEATVDLVNDFMEGETDAEAEEVYTNEYLTRHDLPPAR